MEWKDDVGREIAENIARRIAKGIAIGIAIAIAFVFFIFLGGLVVQWLWNWLLPDIFGLREVAFWEALGLLALSRILFGSFGGGGGHHRHGSDRRGREWWKRRSERQQPAATPVTASGEGQS
jgi:hypothetical protein